MQKWEYQTGKIRVHKLPGEGLLKLPIYKWGCIINEKFISEREYLTSMGQMGWELTGTVTTTYPQAAGGATEYRLYFKRPLDE